MAFLSSATGAQKRRSSCLRRTLLTTHAKLLKSSPLILQRHWQEMRSLAVDNKFKVGQMVDFVPSQAAIPRPVRAYKILRLLPHDGGDRLYRIKTISEAFERIAKECELVRSSPGVVILR